jgi:dGTPase
MPNQAWHLTHSNMISDQISDVFYSTVQCLKEKKIISLQDVYLCGDKLVCFSQEMQEKMKELQKFLFLNLYRHPEIHRKNKQGHDVITALFEAFTSDLNLLPTPYQNRLGGEDSIHRIVSDYIAGMTDGYAKKEYENIYV